MREPGTDTRRAGYISQRPAQDPIFIAVMKNAENVHPCAARGIGATTKLRVIAPVCRVELKRWAFQIASRSIGSNPDMPFTDDWKQKTKLVHKRKLFMPEPP